MSAESVVLAGYLASAKEVALAAGKMIREAHEARECGAADSALSHGAVKDNATFAGERQVGPPGSRALRPQHGSSLSALPHARARRLAGPQVDLVTATDQACEDLIIGTLRRPSAPDWGARLPPRSPATPGPLRFPPAAAHDVRCSSGRSRRTRFYNVRPTLTSAALAARPCCVETSFPIFHNQSKPPNPSQAALPFARLHRRGVVRLRSPRRSRAERRAHLDR